MPAHEHGDPRVPRLDRRGDLAGLVDVDGEGAVDAAELRLEFAQDFDQLVFQAEVQNSDLMFGEVPGDGFQSQGLDDGEAAETQAPFLGGLNQERSHFFPFSRGSRKKGPLPSKAEGPFATGGVDGIRTRGLRRDRPAL